MNQVRRVRLVLLLVALAAAFALPLGAVQLPSRTGQTTIVRTGRLWDGTRTLNNATLVIIDGKFTAVTPGNTRLLIEGAVEIDLTPYTVIPGLIDLHTHITYFWNHAEGTTPLRQPSRPAAETATVAAENAMRTLETGVTTIRDLGAGGGADYLMRDQAASRTLVGPRMFVAGAGISAGRNGGPAIDAIPGLVDMRVRAGSDWIKAYGSRGSYQSVDTTQTLTYDQMKAIVDAAHGAGRKVAIHSYGASGVKDAVNAGADSIEHGIELDDATLTEMVKRGTVWVPTVDHNRYYVDARDEFQFAPDTIAPLQAYIEKNLESVRRAAKAGVKLGMGSDAVFTMFGQNTRELEWFVKAGMTPVQALATATTTAAALLGQAESLGRIEKGYRADLVAVEGDPTRDVQAVIKGVRLVMKDGAIVVDHDTRTHRQ